MEVSDLIKCLSSLIAVLLCLNKNCQKIVPSESFILSEVTCLYVRKYLGRNDTKIFGILLLTIKLDDACLGSLMFSHCQLCLLR